MRSGLRYLLASAAAYHWVPSPLPFSATWSSTAWPALVTASVTVGLPSWEVGTRPLRLSVGDGGCLVRVDQAGGVAVWAVSPILSSSAWAASRTCGLVEAACLRRY